MNENTRKVLKLLIFSAVLIFIMVIIPQTIGLARGGFEISEVLTQFNFYNAPGIGALLIIILLTIVEIFTKKDENLYGSGLGFMSAGEFPHLTTPKSIAKFFGKPFQMFLLFGIIFSILGLFAGATQQTFFGIGEIQQQFTKFDNLIYSASLVATSENLGAGAVFALVLFGIRYWAKKNNLGKNNFLIISYLIVPLSVAIYGIVNHLLRYGSQDQSLVNILGIWFAGGILTMVTGSFIPFWVLHIVNNIFFEIGKLFSNDIILVYVGIAVVVMGALLYFFASRPEKEVIT